MCNMQIHRLFEIVYILLQKERCTAKELAERFEVSTRTIYRDLDTLSAAGIPLYTNKGSHGGIFLMEDYTLNRSMLSDEEQQHLLSALQSYHIANHEDINPLLTKLTGQFHKQQINWIDVDFNDWSGDAKGGETFAKIKEAIFSNVCIQFDYFNSYGQQTKRTIEPFRLFFKGQAWYVIGYCLDKQDQRMFKLYRMKDPTIIKQPIQHSIDEEQIKKAYQYDKSEYIHIKACIAPSQVFRVYDEYTPEHYELQKDGSMLLHIAFPKGEWVYSYLMGFGDALTVIEPLEIKEELIRRYHHILQQYAQEEL